MVGKSNRYRSTYFTRWFCTTNLKVCIYNNLRQSGKTFDHSKRIIIVMTYTFKMIGDRGQADFVRIFNKLYDSVKDGLNMSQIPIK